MRKPLVAIVGRPNVGKSTLFNRLIQEPKAIVEDTPGVTRDRLYGEAEWRGRQFTVVDTGGLLLSGTGEGMAAELETAVRRQVEVALLEADLILFLVDGRTGPLPLDEEIADLLRRTGKPVLLVVNKMEHRMANPEVEIAPFYALGFGDPQVIAAAQGLGMGDFLDALVRLLPAGPAGEEAEPTTIHVAVVGRPNVGKSSLVNALLGEERVLVSEVPGTTRDAVDTPFRWQERQFVLIDTAGLRRKSKIEEEVERYSVVRTLRAVERAEVVVAMLEATEGVTEQDERIVGFAHEAGRGLVLAVNKWDLIAKDERTMLRYTEKIRDRLAFAAYAPLVFISARTRQRLPRLLEVITQVAEEHAKRVPTSALNDLLAEAVALVPPPTDKGKRLKIYYLRQIGVKPPQFLLSVNEPELMHFSYQRYLENKLREAFGFQGTPLVLRLKKH